MNTLLIKNGRLFDPASKLDERADILLEEGIISAIGSFEPKPGWQTVDASGCIVTPGLIDMHANLYPFLPTGIQAESACFATGVTTAVDAGSSGCGTYPYYRPFLQYSKLRMKVFLHVSTAGIIEHPIAENVDPIHFDAKRIGEVLKICGDEIMGLKIRISREIVGELGYDKSEERLDLLFAALNNPTFTALEADYNNVYVGEYAIVRVCTLLGVSIPRFERPIINRDPEEDSGGGAGSESSGGGGIGVGTVYGSNDIVLDPMTGEFVEYGTILDDYFYLDAKPKIDGGAYTEEEKKALEKYYDILYNGFDNKGDTNNE